MERCAAVTKVVKECTHRTRPGGFRVARCKSETIAQDVCVTSLAYAISDDTLEQAVTQWRRITTVDWKFHSLYSYIYPLTTTSELGHPSEVLWK